MGLIEDSLLERNFNNSLQKLVVAASVFLQRWGWFIVAALALGYTLQVRTRGRAAYRRLRDRVFAYDKERLLELDERRARARANLLAVAATEQLEAAVRAEQQAEAVRQARLDELDRKATNLGFKPRLKGGRKLGQGADAAVPSE